jgi:flagellar biosynthesis protein FlhA
LKLNLAQLGVPIGVVGIILLLVVPVPAPLLDVLLVCSVLLAFLTLLISMFVQKPLDFSVFPSLLLVATLFRLGLNVASTRLVLGQGHAGQVIDAMGKVTVGGNMIIGLVIFMILVVIQFVVVTKGAERVAEVGARFKLDAMPGKQMAIDAELAAGAITDTVARERRAEVAAEADFYGSMDGASKFVKGDAIAGIILIVINLVAGIAIGMAQHGMDIMEAVNTYSLLTIGDGLVTQIPALLMAVSTGMIVTRSTSEADIGTTASAQLSQSPTALLLAGCALILMGFIPGMPILIFVGLGALMVFCSRKAKDSKEAKALAAAEAQTAATEEPEEDPAAKLIRDMQVTPMEILLATDMIDLVSDASDDLLGRVKSLRATIAKDLGVVFPQVRTRDSVELEPGTYAINIAGIEEGRGTAPAGKMLALGDLLDALPGTPTTEPIFGLAGKWIPAEMRHSAEMTGATVIDRASVLITHLQNIVTRNASRLLSREDVRVLTESVKTANPSAVEELTPSLMSLGDVQRVLQGLLAEQVPINDLPRLYEAMGLKAKSSTDPETLIETCRKALGPVVAARHVEDNVLRVLTMDPALEQSFFENLRPSEDGARIVTDAVTLNAVLTSLQDQHAMSTSVGYNPVLVCAPALRQPVRRLLREQSIDIPVLSYQEATASAVTIETTGVIRHVQAANA